MTGKKINAPKINLSHNEIPNQNKENEHRPPERTKKEKWTATETEALIAGVEKHGKCWKQILSEGGFSKSRKIADLASKYNLLYKDSSYYHTKDRDWVLVEQDGSMLEDWTGNIVTVMAKFPYDAAMKYAKDKVRLGNKSFKITIRPVDDAMEFHRY
jgi:hypothetical protein